jgi:ABC-type dipeptide/oligopeptide/nickel transport system permease component
MNQSMLRIALDWFPILFFIGVLIFFMRKLVPRQRTYMQSSQQYMSEHLAEVKRMNETLARIAKALESRTSNDR